MLSWVPLACWLAAAASDWHCRRVPNVLFAFLGGLAGIQAITGRVSLLALALSLAIWWPLAILSWRRYDLGGADAKAIMAGAALYPTQSWLFLTVAIAVALPFAQRKELPLLPGFAAGAVVVTVF